jgi:polyisoprenoid-binding protein YceI
MAVFGVAAILALAVFGLDLFKKPASMAGSWQVDTRHSNAKLIADATADYGKTKMNVTLGFASVNGRVEIDNDPTKSSVDLRIYPATSASPAIDEDGKFLSHWLENLSSHTLVCFRSKRVVRMSDGRLQTTGKLAVTRVDRNVEMTPNEAYAGPVYGPPVIHRVSRQATFVCDFPAAGNGQKVGYVKASGSTSMFREDFPQLVRTVVSTYWPPGVQDENCQVPDANEAYNGSKCTGTFMETHGLPEAPHAANAEDLPGSPNFNAIVGEHLTILVQMRLTAKASVDQAAARN